MLKPKIYQTSKKVSRWYMKMPP